MQHAVVPRLCFLQQPSGFSSDPSGSLSSPGISGIHFGWVPTSVHTDKCFQLLNFKCLKNPCEVIEHFFKGSSGGKHYFKRAGSKGNGQLVHNTTTELHLHDWQEHVTTQLCKPQHNHSSQTPGSQPVLVFLFQCYCKYPLR